MSRPIINSIIDCEIVYGSIESLGSIRPITNLPPNAQVRFRFRSDEIAFVYVRTPNETFKSEILKDGDNWKLGFKTEYNTRWMDAEVIPD